MKLTVDVGATGIHTRSSWGGWGDNGKMDYILVNGETWYPPSECEHVFNATINVFFFTRVYCTKCGQRRLP